MKIQQALKLKKGDRVKSNSESENRLFNGRKVYGVIAHTPRLDKNTPLIAVIKDGNVSIGYYHIDFWDISSTNK